MTDWQRNFDLQRGVIDRATGEFPAVTFTNGEASDGHIIDVASLVVPDVVPMFINHEANPARQMGQLNSPRKSGKATRLGGQRLHQIGRINTDGDGEFPDVRRDIVEMIHRGDVTQMSGRWSNEFESVARSSLAKSHFAFTEDRGGFSTPQFIRNAKVLESSIVGLASDQAAMIGRSQDLAQPEHVRTFWRVMAEGDELTQAEALRCLGEEASRIDGLEQIETTVGPFFVPRDVAMVWDQSVDETPRGLVVTNVSQEVLDTLPTERDVELLDLLTSEEIQGLARKLDAEMMTPAETEPEASREEAAPTVEPPESPAALLAHGAEGEGFNELLAYMKASRDETDSYIKKMHDDILYRHRGVIKDE